MKIFSFLFGTKGKTERIESDSNLSLPNSMELAKEFLSSNNILGLEQAVSDLFVKGDYEASCRLVSDFLSIDPDTKTMGSDFKDGVGEKNLFAAKHIMNSNYLTDSMDLPNEKNLELRGAIATHFLLSCQKIESKEIEEKIKSILPELDCPPIREYFEKGEPGRRSHFEYEDFRDRASLFYHMIWQEAYSTFDFLRHTAKENKETRTGIKVMGGDSNCTVCRGEQTYFTWDNLENVPRLPLYPGCICWYSFGNKK